MIACIDVGYQETVARAACAVIDNWQDATAVEEQVAKIFEVNDYQPGEFFRRELPCIEAVLAKLSNQPTCIVVDGYVWLNQDQKPGLGAYLHEKLNHEVPIIGVAKSPFKDTNHAIELRRGTSKRPLYVTAAGIPVTLAADYVRIMHGKHRLPTVLKRVDLLSRGRRPNA